MLQAIQPAAAEDDQGWSLAASSDLWSGLHAAATEPGGTSADVFKGWNQPRYQIYGKTGTAERGGQADQSWYVGYAPDRKRPIVLAVTVEQGGFGAEAAAPAARLIISKWFGEKASSSRGRRRRR